MRWPSCWRYRPSMQGGLLGLPDSLRDTATAEALEALADLELTALADIEPPRGYGRD